VSASSQLIATAISQWRNAAISCMINKNDPFNAITCVRNMAAMLPKNEKEALEKKIAGEKMQEPESTKDWADDPEDTHYTTQAWSYFREYTYLVEQEVAIYVANIQTRRQF